MNHQESKDEAVLASLRCQEVGSLVRVELRIYRYNAAHEEVTLFAQQREQEIQQDFERMFAQVMSEARQRRWPHPFVVAVLAGPQGPLQVGPLPWEQRALA